VRTHYKQIQLVREITYSFDVIVFSRGSILEEFATHNFSTKLSPYNAYHKNAKALR